MGYTPEENVAIENLVSDVIIQSSMRCLTIASNLFDIDNEGDENGILKNCDISGNINLENASGEIAECNQDIFHGTNFNQIIDSTIDKLLIPKDPQMTTSEKDEFLQSFHFSADNVMKCVATAKNTFRDDLKNFDDKTLKIVNNDFIQTARSQIYKCIHEGSLTVNNNKSLSTILNDEIAPKFNLNLNYLQLHGYGRGVECQKLNMLNYIMYAIIVIGILITLYMIRSKMK